MAETTALGAAMAAGFAEGIKVWDLDHLQPTPNDTFTPVITDEGTSNCSNFLHHHWPRAGCLTHFKKA